MPYSILVGSDTLTRNAPLVLFRVGVCERGRPIIRHPCRGDRPDWCGQSIQPWPPESQSLVLTTCVCLVRHVPSDTRLPEKLVRVAFPWHLGTRRLTAHRPLGVEASCFEPRKNETRRASRMDLKGCFQPDGRDQETGSHAVGSPPIEDTSRARPQAEHTTLWPSAFRGCRVLHARPPRSLWWVRENRSPTIFRGFLLQKRRFSAFQGRTTNHQICP